MDFPFLNIMIMRKTLVHLFECAEEKHTFSIKLENIVTGCLSSNFLEVGTVVPLLGNPPYSLILAPRVRGVVKWAPFYLFLAFLLTPLILDPKY